LTSWRNINKSILNNWFSDLIEKHISEGTPWEILNFLNPDRGSLLSHVIEQHSYFWQLINTNMINNHFSNELTIEAPFETILSLLDCVFVFFKLSNENVLFYIPESIFSLPFLWLCCVSIHVSFARRDWGVSSSIVHKLFHDFPVRPSIETYFRVIDEDKISSFWRPLRGTLCTQVFNFMNQVKVLIVWLISLDEISSDL